MGVRVQRVQRVQKVQRVKVGGCAANMNKTFTTGLRPMENRPTALAGEGKASPFGGFATTFPPQAGAQQPVICFMLLMR